MSTQTEEPKTTKEPQATKETEEPKEGKPHSALGKNLSSFGVSVVVHTLILGAMWFIRNEIVRDQEEFAVESVLNDDERVQEEITQQLQKETEVAQTANVISGGVVSTNVGSATNPTVAKVKMDTSELIKTDVKVNASQVNMPGDSDLGDDLGEGEVTGDIGAVVTGYGPALSRLTQEILRHMREQKVLVVWLFDQSDSMKDDHKEIAANFHKVYEELGIVQKQDEKLKTRIKDQILQTMIVAYGEAVKPMFKEPTADIKVIEDAIKKIPIDETGKENMCSAIQAVADEYGRRVQRDKRKLLIVVVSDESGDDGQLVENTIEKVKKLKAPVYVLGRESVFGYPYARIRWQDPKYHLWHWLQINRGPETAYPECLQWDGLHHRWDVHNSGFGPYEQVRLVKESGGIFFVLPGEEEDLTGEGARERREYAALDMKPYTPMLLPRRDYVETVKHSNFRKTIWDVIVRLNPTKHPYLENFPYDKNLNIREHWYSLSPAEFREEAAGEVKKAANAMQLLNTAIGLLERIKPERASERFDRWRANYDLIHAQCIAYRVRLFQFLLAMDDHAAHMPKPKDPKTNRWNVGRSRQMIVPDEGQFERLKKAFGIKKSREEYLAYVKAEEDRAVAMYQIVLENHPRTPWARRAKYELDHGFGMHFYEAYRDPNYDRRDIKLPKP